MRLLQYPAAFHPVLYRIGSWMGVPVVVALLLFTFNLMRTMKPGRSRTPTRGAAPRPPAFVSTLPVR